ncbi:hypothetical protein ATJ97_0051 [Georgenia soli]|uniref:Uncharacterized protein n=1 Tax=Georgenia soli TaxID=638953 RepID=A0A2A9F3Q1_9MICO|nr:hypothetical protein [Georgenia soli]PFG45130.1 hypothetical protein ATJ97_0051 [Georgenia soli]
MSQNSGSDRWTTSGKQLEEKSLLGSSYSYQYGEKQGKEVDPSEDD